LSKAKTAAFGAILAAVGFLGGYYYFQASAPAPQCSIDDAPPRLSAEQAPMSSASQPAPR